jgi:hypothetical protein
MLSTPVSRKRGRAEGATKSHGSCNDCGAEGVLHCRLSAVRATIRFSRAGRKDNVREATVNLVEAVPVDGQTESLVLATTLPVQTRA